METLQGVGLFVGIILRSVRINLRIALRIQLRSCKPGGQRLYVWHRAVHHLCISLLLLQIFLLERRSHQSKFHNGYAAAVLCLYGESDGLSNARMLLFSVLQGHQLIRFPVM
ncbi:uncharacterized protein TM35_000064520 [Trypanosoma theileri]|uniref:Uncharacterized protein n=1 Tax=Trypanosoma theileri TaxID=67003 RepID=A0A1X0P3F6_9TRYP|nr:uncharacterized protein TM35_000064520 [Trypanosoma theileri]ORC91447.1 hypothetical protein TM35_000064520 [Trypanosoma theileri]